MFFGKSFLAIIPARGGSKSVPKKNIKPLGNKPLIKYTFEQVSKVKNLDYVLVSTDDEEIANVSQNESFRVIKRPHEISRDNSSTESALLHAIDKLEKEGRFFDYVVVLEPTSPFRKSSTIDECISLIYKLNADSLLTLKESYSNIGNFNSHYFIPIRPNQPRRRQDRKPFYIESSTLYIAKIDFLKATKSLVSDKWAAYILKSDEESVDINNLMDFYFAETLLSSNNFEKN